MSKDFSPPWQSFVDCLSTVLLIMVFFSIVLVILVSVLSYSVSQKEATREQQQQEQAQGQEAYIEKDAEQGPSVTDADDIEALLSTDAERFIIYYHDLLTNPTEENVQEFHEWMTQNNPNNTRTVVILQQLVVDEISLSDRRNIAFRRYHFLSRYLKNEMNYKKVIMSYSIVKGSEAQNRAIISFED